MYYLLTYLLKLNPARACYIWFDCHGFAITYPRYRKFSNCNRPNETTGWYCIMGRPCAGKWSSDGVLAEVSNGKEANHLPIWWKRYQVREAQPWNRSDDKCQYRSSLLLQQSNLISEILTFNQCSGVVVDSFCIGAEDNADLRTVSYMYAQK